MAVSEKLLDTAKWAEQAERYVDMACAMKAFVKLASSVLKEEERNMFSAAYKNVVGAKRSAWRVVSSLEKATPDKPMISDYRKEIEAELFDVCREVLLLLGENLIPLAENVESKVFYHKMKGDYQRYIAEVSTGEERDAAVDEAKEAYQEARQFANDLDATHPIRLGLALNFSVFFYEIQSSPDEAIMLAKTAFDEAIAELDSLKDNTYKDSTLIMQLLRDNLTLWTSEDNAEDSQ